MTEISEKIRIISEIFDKNFPDPKPTLKFFSPFTLLTAVMLSAQCTDERVNTATEKLFKAADTPEKMAALDQEDIYNYIYNLGLAKNKAKFLHTMANQLLTDFHGTVPQTFKELESLAGVGHKTASVVMAQAFNIPAFPVDTHIFRLARRWKISSGKDVKQVEEDLKRLFPPEEWNRRHIQFINFGRRFCRASGHKEELCPICSLPQFK